MASGVTRDTILRSSVAETLLSLTLFTPENASKVSRTEPLFTQKYRRKPFKCLANSRT